MDVTQLIYGCDAIDNVAGALIASREITKRLREIIQHGDISTLQLGENKIGEWFCLIHKQHFNRITMSIWTNGLWNPNRVKFEIVKCESWEHAVRIYESLQAGKISHEKMCEISYNVVNCVTNERIFTQPVSVEEWLKS